MWLFKAYDLFQHSGLQLITRCPQLSYSLHIFVGLMMMLCHRETHINPQSNRWIIVDRVGIELTTARLRQPRQLPVVQHVRFMPLKLCKKHNPNDINEAALENWQSVWNTPMSISTPVCVNFDVHPGTAIHICVNLILMLWHREPHINPQSNR